MTTERLSVVFVFKSTFEKKISYLCANIYENKW